MYKTLFKYILSVLFINELMKQKSVIYKQLFGKLLLIPRYMLLVQFYNITMLFKINSQCLY